MGIISRWSGTDPLVAFVKFRSFLAPLSLVLVYSLLRRLTPTRSEAGVAFAVVVLFIGLDMGTWESNSLFPLVRRGGVSAGVLVPALLVLFLAASRQAQDPAARMTRRVALITAPAMLLASLTTHPLEMFTLLCFAAGMTFTILAGLDRTADRKQVLALMLLLTTVTAGYLAIQSRMVPYVAEYKRGDTDALRVELGQLASDPIGALTGGPSPGRDLLSRSMPGTTAIVFGIPALALALLRVPATASMLVMGIVPLALAYASPVGFAVLALLTSTETVRDVSAYFSLLGLVSLALGLTALAHLVFHAASLRKRSPSRVIAVSIGGSLVLWAVWTGGRAALRQLSIGATAGPELLLLTAVVTAVIVLSVAFRTRVILQPRPFPVGTLALTMCLALACAAPEWAFGGIFETREPVTANKGFLEALSSPSVLDWPSYYEELKTSIAPPLPVPRTVVDELRRHVPSRQVVLADPDYSCALVVLLDAYCINPASVYGHYFQPAEGYFAKYVREGDGQTRRHPFFNDDPSLSDGERELLRDYRVSYILTDPEFAEAMALKLGAGIVGATLEMDQEGYRLYKVTGS
jgi:predicted tellurium resistance membrane protein TerC